MAKVIFDTASYCRRSLQNVSAGKENGPNWEHAPAVLMTVLPRSAGVQIRQITSIREKSNEGIEKLSPKRPISRMARVILRKS